MNMFTDAIETHGNNLRNKYVLRSYVARTQSCDKCVHRYLPHLYPLYTGTATFVPPLCDHKTGQVAVEGTTKAERLPWWFKGGTEDVQTLPWMPWSPWSFEHVRNSRTKVAEEVGRSQVAQSRQEEYIRIAVVAEWMHRLVIGRPVKNCVLLYTFCINLSYASASLVPPLCLLWPTNSVLWVITVATTVPPFGDQGNRWATLAIVLPPPTTLLVCHYNNFGGSRNAQRSCCSNYTETKLSQFGQPMRVLINFLVAQRWHEGRSSVIRWIW